MKKENIAFVVSIIFIIGVIFLAISSCLLIISCLSYMLGYLMILIPTFLYQNLLYFIMLTFICSIGVSIWYVLKRKEAITDIINNSLSKKESEKEDDNTE